jgi:molybdopterin-synthase adenylyltransferase
VLETNQQGLSDQDLLRYSRHILLDEMGIEVQERFAKANVLVIGAGGLGSPALLYLASAGIGCLTLADHDVVDLTNLQRQILHRNDRIGQSKVTSGKQTIKQLNPQVQVVCIEMKLLGEQLLEQVRKAHVVLDCSDNFATRHAVNRACFASGVPLVSGAGVRWDGQLSVFDPRDATSPCYHCLFPEDPTGNALVEERCATMGVFAPLTGVIGTLQAAQALQIVGQFGSPAVGRLLLFDSMHTRFSEMQIGKDLHCTVCSQ